MGTGHDIVDCPGNSSIGGNAAGVGWSVGMEKTWIPPCESLECENGEWRCISKFRHTLGV
jgi:hypothetical protein